MAKHKNKLELTWIGKDKRPKLEPRILLEDPSKSYHAKQSVTDNDIFDNKLIFGDNLLALKALEQEYTGKVKCIYIDPPFNTGQAFDHYDDGIEHSLWLSLMKSRLEILKNLLCSDGTIWVHLDDNEVHYLRIIMDEIFGRSNFVSSVIWRAADSSNNDAKQFSIDHNVILVYSKQAGWLSNPLPRKKENNKHYKNTDNDPKGSWFSGNVSSPNPRENLMYSLTSPAGEIINSPANGWRWSQERILSMIETGEVVFSDDGSRIIKKTYLANQKGLSPSTLWSDIDDTGHNRQAKYELKKLFPESNTSDLFKTPKPERLIKKILHIGSEAGDIVLDSFGGSGTTSAVAQKMGRKWIMVELEETCHTHIIPRLQKVINGEDLGGISKSVNWQGGGGFRYYTLAPSLLEKDKWDNWVVNKAYNAEMLSEAICKLEGFSYAPSDTEWWNHGYSTESDFIYVTTQNLSVEQLQQISDEVGGDKTLLVCCGAFRCKPGRFSNLTIKKIPKMVLSRCEWAHDDYSLNVENLPQAEREPEQDDLFEGEA